MNTYPEYSKRVKVGIGLLVFPLVVEYLLLVTAMIRTTVHTLF